MHLKVKPLVEYKSEVIVWLRLNNRTQIINKLMRRFNLSEQQLIMVAAVVASAIVSAVGLLE